MENRRKILFLLFAFSYCFVRSATTLTSKKTSCKINVWKHMEGFCSLLAPSSCPLTILTWDGFDVAANCERKFVLFSNEIVPTVNVKNCFPIVCLLVVRWFRSSYFFSLFHSLLWAENKRKIMSKEKVFPSFSLLLPVSFIIIWMLFNNMLPESMNMIEQKRNMNWRKMFEAGKKQKLHQRVLVSLERKIFSILF